MQALLQKSRDESFFNGTFHYLVKCKIINPFFF